MGRPGFYVTDPNAALEFPRGPRYGSAPRDILEGDLVIETEAGKRWVYKQFTRDKIVVNMRLTAEQLEFFRELHQTVGGQETEFYFVPDMDDIDTVVLVRKEPNFEPKELDDPGVVDGEEIALYDYSLTMTQEPDGPEVAA